MDEEVVPVVERLDSALAVLVGSSQRLYDGLVESAVRDMPMEQQLELTMTSAFAIVTCCHALRRLGDQPVDTALLQKVSRVREYMRKLQDSGVGSHPQRTGVAVGAKRTRDQAAAQDAVATAIPSIDTELAAVAEAEMMSAAPAAGKSRRLKVDTAAVTALLQL